MREKYKTQCLNALELVKKAHTVSIRVNGRGEPVNAAALLEECQEVAIAIGTLIENRDKSEEGKQTIHLLEEYCEKLYELHEELLTGNLSQDENGYESQTEKQIFPLLDRIENDIRNEIRTTREAVFLPYKASMWDSLEGVWKKLDADPDWNAVVVPIPYYDKNPDGSFREMHDESANYPKDVPVLSYASYDLEQERPDRIYIHNPYDEGNYVTSVHPDYYSSRLKNLTEELVYIPYFVLDDPDPDNKAVLEGMAHFVTVAAVLNAHKVIVQSEAMRQAYIRVMCEFAGEESRPYWEKKIDGSGSPKLERVANLKESDYELPETWRKLIERADGSKKKVIFYNTGVSALLQEDEAMLDKIERNFQVFQEHREDVVLLWRPHPLIEATLTSMRPHLWERYERLVERYQREGWGIYDDTPELDRAIAVSDAYYGDYSSVVQLYKTTGKPIMIQNVAV